MERFTINDLYIVRYFDVENGVYESVVTIGEICALYIAKSESVEGAEIYRAKIEAPGLIVADERELIWDEDIEKSNVSGNKIIQFKPKEDK